jgi:hypothetical protein
MEDENSVEVVSDSPRTSGALASSLEQQLKKRGFLKVQRTKNARNTPRRRAARRDAERMICCTLREDLQVSKLAREGRFDYLLVESTGISEPLPAAEPRLGRRTVLSFPLLPPPQKN